MRTLLSPLLLVVFSASMLCPSGCARQQIKFETIDKRDRLRFAACRKDVARAMCPDDPDCEIKAAEAYAAEQHHARLQWLRDYKCPEAKVRIADEADRRDEKKRLGQ